MNFTKMHGAGNDFIIFEPDKGEEASLPDLARTACDRHFGIGADGILVPSYSEVADLKMVYLNSDGSYSQMCGNGLRCLARYARDRGLVDRDSLTVETGAGIKKILLFGDGSSRVDMGSPSLGSETELRGYTFLRVSLGNPHVVTFLDSEAEVEALALREVGPSIEQDTFFPEKTNVEFAYP